MTEPNRTSLRLTAAGAAGGLAIGCDMASLTATLPPLRESLHLEPVQTGTVVAVTLAGMLLGSVSSSALATRLGLLRGVRAAALLQLLATLLLLRVSGLTELLAARVCAGIAMGLFSGLCPVLLAETAPVHIRGRISGLFQVALSVGVALAYAFHLALPPHAWRWQFLCPAAAALAAALPAFGGMQVRSDRTIAPHGLLLQARFRRPLVLVVLLATFNQLTGVNALVFYRGLLLRGVRLSATHTSETLLALSLLSTAATCVGVVLLDRAGRRVLLLLGSVVMAPALAVLAALPYAGSSMRSLAVAALLLFDAGFSLSQGAVFWVLLPELLPQEIRLQGLSLGAGVLWLWTIVVTFSFPVMLARHPALPFAIFGAVTVLQFLFVFKFVPETRGRELRGTTTPSHGTPVPR